MSKLAVGIKEYKSPDCNEVDIPLNFQNKPIDKIEEGSIPLNRTLLQLLHLRKSLIPIMTGTGISNLFLWKKEK